jgi:serine/threonine protein kinase
MSVDPAVASVYRLAVPLEDSFRFTHEPLEPGAEDRFVGREEQMEALLDRLTYSHGGAFLITGYRGVGKTSFVNQLLGGFERRSAGSRVVTIRLNLARPVAPVELMFLIIRCVYLELTQRRLHLEIVPDVMNDLRLAYNRTLMTIKETRSAGTEFSLTAPEVETGTTAAKTKFGSFFGYKRTRAKGNETSYLTYEERAAEYDLIQLSRRLRDAWVGRRAWWRRLLRRPGVRQGDLRIVFVFDELDKIEDPEVLDALFSMLKNVFTTSGLTFLFVAGKDVQERWGQEIGRGESIYESVFAYEMYLPCLWTQARYLCAGNFQVLANPPPELETLWRALSFHGRGIPRRILRNFHSFVRWQARQPVLAMTAVEYRDAEFFAGLEGVLEEFRERTADAGSGGRNHPDADKRALGLYYLVDWILERGTREFTLADAIAAYEALNMKLVFSGAMAGQIEALLSELLSRSYIEKTGRIEDKQFIRQNEAPARHYRLTSIAGPSTPTPENDSETPSRFGQYLPLEPIARGGIGRVVRAVDSRSNETVAVKYVRDPSPQMRAIFTAEADALNDLMDGSIPRFRGSELEGDVIWIAMDLIDAASLQQLLARRPRLSEPAAVYAALEIARICGWIHECGYVYGDVKPSNVLATREGKIVLVDFSTARRADAPISAYGVVGTPAYMAPELLRGGASTPRTDVYALGVLLYELVCGRRPYLAETQEELLERIAKQTFRRPSALAVSPALEEVILHCLKADPDMRAPDMAAMIRMLSELYPSQKDLAAEVGENKTTAAARSENVDTQRLRVFSPANPSSPPASPGDVAPPQATQSAPVQGLPTELPLSQSPEAAYLRVWDRDAISPAIDYPLRGTRNRIGRGSDTEIRIDDPSLSRVHAIVSLEGGAYRLLDAGSRNGTMLNGAPLPARGSVTLKPGDRILIGHRALEFQLRDSM